ncbi:hypothetical protein UPYG_G00306610 [Umbra pygmaea]|uniref:Uncharacterized protein n=1 Tax=Umbra pygmaea TaxID=75934 RepID=A0ABD0WFR1_UMBPY
MSYSEVEERPTVVYTLTDFRNYITVAMHKINSISDTTRALDAYSLQLTTESSGVHSEPTAGTSEDDSHDGVEDILASEFPSDGSRFEAESVATGEKGVIILEESLTFPHEHKVTIQDPGIEEEGLLVENTGDTESPQLEVLTTHPTSPDQPEGTMLSKPPVEIEVSGSGVDITEDIPFQGDKDAPVSEKEFTIEQVEAEIPEVEDKVLEVPEEKQEAFAVPEVKDEAVEVPGVQDETVEVPGVQDEAVEVPGVQDETVEVPGVQDETVEVPGVQDETVEVPGVQDEAVEFPEVKEVVEFPEVEKEADDVPDVKKDVVEVPEVEKEADDVPDVKKDVVEIIEVKEDVVEVPVKTEVFQKEVEPSDFLEENIPEAATEVAGAREDLSVTENPATIRILPPDEPEELKEDEVGSLEEGLIIEEPVYGEDTVREMEEVAVVVTKNVVKEVAVYVPDIFEISEKELVDDEVLLVDKASSETIHPTPVSAEKESPFTQVSNIIVEEKATTPEPDTKDGQVTQAVVPAVYRPGPDISITLELQTIDPVTDYDLVQFGGTNQTEDGSSEYPAGVRHARPLPPVQPQQLPEPGDPQLPKWKYCGQ